MHTLPSGQEITRERPWDTWDLRTVDAELEPPVGPDLDDAAAADLLFSAMVTDFDVAADHGHDHDHDHEADGGDPEYNLWLDQLTLAAESCQEDRAAGLILPFPVYIDREQQVQRAVDKIVDAILHKGAILEWCACTDCVLRRTARYADLDANPPW